MSATDLPLFHQRVGVEIIFGLAAVLSRHFVPVVVLLQGRAVAEQEHGDVEVAELDRFMQRRLAELFVPQIDVGALEIVAVSVKRRASNRNQCLDSRCLSATRRLHTCVKQLQHAAHFGLDDRTRPQNFDTSSQ